MSRSIVITVWLPGLAGATRYSILQLKLQTFGSLGELRKYFEDGQHYWHIISQEERLHPCSHPSYEGSWDFRGRKSQSNSCIVPECMDAWAWLPVGEWLPVCMWVDVYVCWMAVVCFWERQGSGVPRYSQQLGDGWGERTIPRTAI